MATRLYVARSFTADLYIAGTLKTPYPTFRFKYDAGWEDTPFTDGDSTIAGGPYVNWLTTSTTEADRGDAQGVWYAWKGATTTDRDTILFQAVSPPMAGSQTISGTLKGQFAFREAAATQDSRAQMCLRVLAPDGTVRGTLYALDANALGSDEFGTVGDTYYNRNVPRGGSQSVTSVAVTAGDRLVLEVGFRSHATGSTVQGSEVAVGNTASSGDLPEDQTTSSGLGVYRGWIELSHDVTWLDNYLETTQVQAEASMSISAAQRYLEVSQVMAEASIRPFWHGWGIVELGDAEATDSEFGTEPSNVLGVTSASRSSSRATATGAVL